LRRLSFSKHGGFFNQAINDGANAYVSAAQGRNPHTGRKKTAPFRRAGPGMGEVVALFARL